MTLHTKSTTSEKLRGAVKKTTNKNSTSDAELKTDGEMMKIWALKGTPFHIVKDEHGYTPIFRQNAIGKAQESLEDAIKDAKEFSWVKVYAMASIIAEETNKNPKTK